MTESDDEEEEATRQPLYLDVVATDIPDMNSEARSEAARQLALHAGVPAEAIIFNADIASEMRKFDATMTTATALPFRDDVHDAAVEYITTGKDKRKSSRKHASQRCEKRRDGGSETAWNEGARRKKRTDEWNTTDWDQYGHHTDQENGKGYGRARTRPWRRVGGVLLVLAVEALELLYRTSVARRLPCRVEAAAAWTNMLMQDSPLTFRLHERLDTEEREP